MHPEMEVHHPRLTIDHQINYWDTNHHRDAVNRQPQSHPLPRIKIPGRGWRPWLANKLQVYKSSAVDNVSIS